MGWGKIASKVMGKIAKKAVSFTPAGRAFTIAKMAGGGLKRIAKIARQEAGMKLAGATGGGSIMSMLSRAVGQTLGIRRKKRSFKGISGKEMMELMKLQMLVGKKSMAYQMAVMKALFGKLK